MLQPTRGFIVTSKITGGAIFLPAVGIKKGEATEGGSAGYYWASDLWQEDSTLAHHMIFANNSDCFPKKEDFDLMQVYAQLYLGQPVRAVRRVAVDMGNGLKWATRNLEASKKLRREFEYGGYFAWGDANTKGNYSWATYRWTQSGESDLYHITKYTFADGRTDGIWYDSNGDFIGDGKTSFADYGYADDPARIKWGGTWRTPTSDEWSWLLNNCTWTWTDDYQGSGIAGAVVTSTVTGFEGNTIFLPVAGYYYNETRGSVGGYWSSSLSNMLSEVALNLALSSSSTKMAGHDRSNGLSVRPVQD